MSEKVFTTIDQQIDILRSRGLDVSDDDKIDYAKRVLSECGYYNLVNGYSKLFLAEAQFFKEGTALNEIHALYQFDRIIRDIFFKYILKVEVHVKSLISYYFSERHGHQNYLIYPNFNTKLKDAPNKIMSLIAEVQKQISGKTSDPSIAHYLNTHGYIPLWVLMNILTFGTVSKFFSLMLQDERQNVARSLKVRDNELESILSYISAVRNFCAHGNRLYCFRSKKPLIDLKYHHALNLPKSSHNEYEYGKRDLFAALLSLRCLLSNNDYSRLEKELFRSIGTLKKKISVISIEDIFSELGFPEKWRGIKK